ncbi:DedA family protein [Microlunatus sp. Gsoil 973]|uniref:DedA family protein n=1 Tax=Microlunatus sp. Gsoil 973 TaxID=2672569 RepID=UPI0012B4699C|nr:DedA family protein [Microlunatus sp. Gsoil 973]QGN35734.1 DedA family protein [Microlunatus sp. Gsoil 973]
MLLPSWMDPEAVIKAFGPYAVWGVAFIIFAECGLFAILPGDSLLFTVGLFIGAGTIGMPLWLVCVLLTVCAVLGNACGYLIGYLVGPPLFRSRSGLLGKIFNPKYVERTHDFLEKYGSRALILARFVPIVRTFVTFAAGVSRMSFGKFILFTAIGGVIWAPGVTILGYFLGNVEIIARHIDLALVLVVVLSLIPMGLEFLSARRKAARAASAEGSINH